MVIFIKGVRLDVLCIYSGIGVRSSSRMDLLGLLDVSSSGLEKQGKEMERRGPRGGREGKRLQKWNAVETEWRTDDAGASMGGTRRST